jgi:hypothetical protein
MTKFLFFSRVIVLAINLLATNLSVSAEPLRDYLWVNRVIITFSNSESNNERRLLIQQIEQHRCDFRKRDLVHIDLIQGTDQYQRLSQRFLISGDEFKLLLLGKDGEVKLNTNSNDLLEIFALIETMPLRKREIQSEKC